MKKMKKITQNVELAPIQELKKRLIEIAHLNSALNILFWDQEVYMPKKGSERRAETVSVLSGLIHNTFVKIDHDGLLSSLKKDLDEKKIKGSAAVIVRETWKSFEKESKLPGDFVKELAHTTSRSQDVWAEARKKNDFKLFSPWLSKMVELKQREAEYIGYVKSPYDALLNEYESGMDSDTAVKILDDVKDFLIPFLQEVKGSKVRIDSKKILGTFPIAEQIVFNEMIAQKIGFNLDAGRLDTTTHPFAMGIHPHDVRITTRYKLEDALYSLGSMIHEAGHGMYEQGLPAEHFGTPLADSVSLGIHESQSRMWENIIGKSQYFWKHFYPKLQKKFPKPFKNISLPEFYTILNKVESSYIRTEADEVTYSLHVILRFEIEKELIEGTVAVEDLPKIWKDKMKTYFGITVPTDSLGVLQDVHWSCGLFGYFPTYVFGNLYASQFFAAMQKDIPDVYQKIGKGEFADINAWLTSHIHTQGKTYKAGELVKKVSGEELNSRYFIEYIKDKYKKLYKI